MVGSMEFKNYVYDALHQQTVKASVLHGRRKCLLKSGADPEVLPGGGDGRQTGGGGSARLF